MSVFVSRTPEHIPHLGHKQPDHVRHLTWSFGLFTSAWVLALATAPIGLTVGSTVAEADDVDRRRGR